MEKIKNNRGVTLVALVVVILTLGIIAGITIYTGKNVIERASLEELKTNMLLIEAKAKECVEQANFKMGISPDEAKKEEVRKEIYGTTSEDGAKLKTIQELKEEMPNIQIPSSIPEDNVYWVTPETMQYWGLDKITLTEKNGKIIEAYFVKFDEENVNVEIYNNIGVEGQYSLENIKDLEI